MNNAEKHVNLNIQPVRVAAIAFGVATLHATTFATTQKLNYEQATQELRSYCVTNVCLGMTISEASHLGRLSWADLDAAKPHGKADCANTLGNRAIGRLMTAEGTELSLAFALVSQSGDPAARYRLTSIELKLPNVSEAQIDHLRETLTTRFGSMRETQKGVIWIGETKSGSFSLSITKVWPTPDAPRELLEKAKSLHVSAQYRNSKEWVMQQEACRSGLPKV